MKIGYVRVSTREQDEGNALDQQTARVEKAGAVMIFSDVESGRSDKRKEFNKMLTLCKQGKVSEVICTRIDRLGRSVVGIHKAIAIFEEYGIKLTVLDAPVDPSSPFGWFSVNQMAGLAEFESRLLANRIKNGMEFFREQKKASPRPPFGYCRVDEKYAPDFSEIQGKSKWAIASDIVDYFLSEKGTLRSTAQYLLATYGLTWTAAGLKYWLTNPVLRGHTAYGIKANLSRPDEWEIQENTHQPLITENTFRKIVRKLQENKFKYSYGNKKETEILPLAGQIICGSCGYKCFCKKSYSTYRIRCKKHENMGGDFCKNRISTYLPDIIAAVDKSLVKRHAEIKEYAVTNSNIDQQDSPELIARQEQLKALKLMPLTPIIQNAIDDTILEIQLIKQKAITINQVNNELFEVLSFVTANPSFWDETPWKDKRLIYTELVDYVTVLNGEILEIKLRV
ncbi:fdxN element excision recombinase XisF [Anabaena azotica]|uniref:Recombinase family protein n=1 Tax=Anabaena azotica FACHB-119 TaxID=947527 RepID=A0ABR8CZC3_9NOST|nr:fdxN element excision recombinase XisF [Anabaena azotica]MBD2499834.1 recombinase family protein [Anabaena azotica FACHB-119]